MTLPNRAAYAALRRLKVLTRDGMKRASGPNLTYCQYRDRRLAGHTGEKESTEA